MISKLLPVLGEKGNTLLKLLTGSVKILGRDKDIYRPLIGMIVVSVIKNMLIAAVMYYAFVAQAPAEIFISIFALFAFLFFENFYQMRCKAISSWMVYDILKGIDTNVSRARKALKGKGLLIFFYGFVDYVVSSANSKRDNGESGGWMSFIMSLAMSFLKEVWDLIKNFSLPAIAIDKVTIREVPEKMKLLKSKTPEALVGILAFDLVGGIAKRLFSVITTPVMFGAFFLAYKGLDYLPAHFLIYDVENGSKPIINMLPLMVAVVFTGTINGAIKSLVILIKSSYFTVFYVAITRPGEVIDELKEHVNHYLDTDHRTGDFDFFGGSTSKTEKPKPKKSQIKKAPKQEVKELGESYKEEDLLRYAKVIERNVNKGHDEIKVSKKLAEKVGDKHLIRAALTYYRKNLR